MKKLLPLLLLLASCAATPVLEDREVPLPDFNADILEALICSDDQLAVVPIGEPTVGPVHLKIVLLPSGDVAYSLVACEHDD